MIWQNGVLPIIRAESDSAQGYGRMTFCPTIWQNESLPNDRAEGDSALLYSRTLFFPSLQHYRVLLLTLEGPNSTISGIVYMQGSC